MDYSDAYDSGEFDAPDGGSDDLEARVDEMEADQAEAERQARLDELREQQTERQREWDEQTAERNERNCDTFGDDALSCR